MRGRYPGLGVTLLTWAPTLRQLERHAELHTIMSKESKIGQLEAL